MRNIQPLDILAANLIASAGNNPNIFTPTDNDSMGMVYNAMYQHTKSARPSDLDVRHMHWIFSRNRPWFYRETTRYHLHDMVDDLLTGKGGGANLRRYITDWREMLLEWPHSPTSEQHQGLNKISYTQSQEKGERDIQTVTSLGKYLKRHMPTCPDHLLRDFVTRYTIDPKSCKITTNLEKMIHVIQNGPPSCMKKERWGEDNHPYNVYDPELGWGMAYRLQGDEYWGRAIVHIPTKTFVRTYKGNPASWDVSQSRDDEMLEAWLINEGYTHVQEWDGQSLAKIENNYGEYIMPYLDGDNKEVDDHGDCFVICRHGDFGADNTEGVISIGVTCDDCDGTFDEDDMTYVEDGDRHVCDHCLARNYVHAWVSRHGTDWVRQEDTIYCESNGEYYGDYVYRDFDIEICEDSGEYYKIDDMWCCEGSGNWYHDSVTSHIIDDERYHEDHLPDGWELDEHGELREVETA